MSSNPAPRILLLLSSDDDECAAMAEAVCRGVEAKGRVKLSFAVRPVAAISDEDSSLDGVVLIRPIRKSGKLSSAWESDFRRMETVWGPARLWGSFPSSCMLLFCGCDPDDAGWDTKREFVEFSLVERMKAKGLMDRTDVDELSTWFGDAGTPSTLRNGVVRALERRFQDYVPPPRPAGSARTFASTSASMPRGAPSSRRSSSSTAATSNKPSRTMTLEQIAAIKPVDVSQRTVPTTTSRGLIDSDDDDDDDLTFGSGRTSYSARTSAGAGAGAGPGSGVGVAGSRLNRAPASSRTRSHAPAPAPAPAPAWPWETADDPPSPASSSTSSSGGGLFSSFAKIVGTGIMAYSAMTALSGGGGGGEEAAKEEEAGMSLHAGAGTTAAIRAAIAAQLSEFMYDDDYVSSDGDQDLTCDDGVLGSVSILHFSPPFADVSGSPNQWCLFRVTRRGMPPVLVIAFRGTRSTVDWLTNIAAVPASVTCSKSTKLHVGFYYTAVQQSGTIAAKLAEALADLPPTGPEPEVWVTGHSQGGAVAGCLFVHMLSLWRAGRVPSREATSGGIPVSAAETFVESFVDPDSCSREFDKSRPAHAALSRVPPTKWHTFGFGAPPLWDQSSTSPAHLLRDAPPAEFFIHQYDLVTRCLGKPIRDVTNLFSGLNLDAVLGAMAPTGFETSGMGKLIQSVGQFGHLPMRVTNFAYIEDDDVHEVDAAGMDRIMSVSHKLNVTDHDMKTYAEKISAWAHRRYDA